MCMYVCLSLSSKCVCSSQVKIRVMNNVVIVTYTSIGEDTLSEAILIVLDCPHNPMCLIWFSFLSQIIMLMCCVVARIDAITRLFSQWFSNSEFFLFTYRKFLVVTHSFNDRILFALTTISYELFWCVQNFSFELLISMSHDNKHNFHQIIY